MAFMPRLLSGAPRSALLLLICGLTLLASGTAAGAAESGPTVDVLRVGGPIDRTIVDYIDGALAKAADEGVEVVVLELDSTGLLDVDLGDVLAPIAEREVPLAVRVGPPGARATGGAAWIAAAADVVAVAPGTVYGGAAQVSLGRMDAVIEVSGPGVPGTVGQVAESLEADDLLTNAVVATTQPEAVLPEDAALPSGLAPADVRVVDDATLLESGVVDEVAVGLDDVLRELDGREVTIGGETRTLDIDPVTANVRFNNQGLWGRILHSVANPTLAYLLLVAGLMAVAFEFFQPGFGVAGLSGLFVAALGTYGLTVLPTRPLMAALIVLGVALLSIDLAVGGFGLVTLAGTAALAIGSARLYGGAGLLSVPDWLIAAVVAFAVAFFVGIMTTVLRAQGAQARAGAARVTGKLGVVRSMLNPEGHVFVEGALWRGRAPEAVGRVKTGTPVRVVGTSDGLTLDVELAEDADRAAVAQ
jgi:membrane-bound serine protease (ClpP class)